MKNKILGKRGNNKSLDTISDLLNTIDILQKALDLACEELESLSYVKGLGQVGMCYAEWKEYLLKRAEE